MKLLLVVSIAVLATALADEAEQDLMYFPDGDGNLHVIDLKAEIPPNAEEILRSSSITYLLYTSNNPKNGEILTLDDVSSIQNSNWDSSRPTRVITHGWKSSHESDSCTIIRDAYLAAGDYNVIVVDWSPIAAQLYILACSRVTNVGKEIGTMLDFLQNNAGLDPSTTTVIGHSLGGHIAGLAARSASGSISSVVSLDPAMPLFTSSGPGSRVDKTDADHVQVIHTNGGLLGLFQAVGDSDFYPNGGRSQPGCILDLAGTCAHSRAYLFFAESIGNPTGFRSLSTFSTYSNLDVFMGGRELSTHASGSYTLTTARSSPFALG